MRRVLSFGSYSFPDTQDQFSDNFTNTVTRTIRLPDLSGGFDELGVEPAPTEVGSVKMKFLLLAETSAEVTQKRDAVRAMAGWGVRKLLVQPSDTSLPPRYTYARIQNIGTPENAKKLATWQDVNIDFQVSYPRWMQDAGSGASWGSAAWGGFSWGGSWPTFGIGSASSAGDKWGTKTWGGFTWGAGQAASITLTNNGNAISTPQLLLTCTEAIAGGLLIERLVDGLVRESLLYRGAIAVGQILSIDCRALSVQLDGSGSYAYLDYTHPAWLRLAPGVNTLRVTVPSGGGLLKFIYPHTWY